MSEVLYAGGKGKERLVIANDHIECGDVVIPTRAITSVETKSNILSIFGWVSALAIFALFQIGRDANFLGYGVLAFAALSAIVLPISFPAKVIVRAEGRNHQLAQGSRLEMREVKDAVTRALVGGRSS